MDFLTIRNRLNCLWKKRNDFDEAKEKGAVGHVEIHRELFFENTSDAYEHTANGWYSIEIPGDDENWNLVDLSAVEDGDLCAVYFDGVRYECKVGKPEVVGGPGHIAFYAVTDKPFNCAYYSDGGVSISTTLPGARHTLSAYKETEVVHTIDPKFLPDDVDNEIGSAEIWSIPVMSALTSAMSNGGLGTYTIELDSNDERNDFMRRLGKAEKIQWLYNNQLADARIAVKTFQPNSDVLFQCSTGALINLHDNVILANFLCYASATHNVDVVCHLLPLATQ